MTENATTRLERSIEAYHPEEIGTGAVRATRLGLLSGIAGAGKNTVINELKKTGHYHELISHTTRAPRVNHGIPEKEGVHYHFVTLEKAQDLIDKHAFVEVKYVHGNVYGTSLRELGFARDAGKIAVADVDIQGAVEYLDIKPDTHAIFLLPPSVSAWTSRLEGRYGDLKAHEDEIIKRFRTARTEIQHIQQDDRFIVVVNDDLESTVQRIQEIVDGTVVESSEYAEAIAERLLDHIDSKI